MMTEFKMEILQRQLLFSKYGTSSASIIIRNARKTRLLEAAFGRSRMKEMKMLQSHTESKLMEETI